MVDTVRFHMNRSRAHSQQRDPLATRLAATVHVFPTVLAFHLATLAHLPTKPRCELFHSKHRISCLPTNQAENRHNTQFSSHDRCGASIAPLLCPSSIVGCRTGWISTQRLRGSENGKRLSCYGNRDSRETENGRRQRLCFRSSLSRSLSLCCLCVAVAVS